MSVQVDPVLHWSGSPCVHCCPGAISEGNSGDVFSMSRYHSISIDGHMNTST